MNYSDSRARMQDLRRRIEETRREMHALRDSAEPESVVDYTFSNLDGPIRLSDLFGRRKELFVIHNMGTSCPACTMWADGYNGVYDHLTSRAALVVSSPDAPEVQRQFASSRGWRFPMVSHAGTKFAEDMGYRSARGGWMPGVSVFRRGEGGLLRVGDTAFGPGDDFCSVWHFLDLLPGGAADWHPRFAYPKD